MDFGTKITSALSDQFHNSKLTTPELIASIESFAEMASVSISDYNTLMNARKALLSVLVEECGQCKREVPNYVVGNSQKAFSITIDFDTLFSVLLCETEVLTKIIKELSTIPEDGILNVFSSLPFEEFGYIMLFDGVCLANLLQLAKCKKVFQFGATATSADLLIASRCDEVEVGDYASICLVKADNTNIVSGYVKDAYRDLVRFTYRYWVEKGLFTPEEITGLFSNEAEHSIVLFSDEIKRRLGK